MATCPWLFGFGIGPPSPPCAQTHYCPNLCQWRSQFPGRMPRRQTDGLIVIYNVNAPSYQIPISNTITSGLASGAAPLPLRLLSVDGINAAAVTPFAPTLRELRLGLWALPPADLRPLIHALTRLEVRGTFYWWMLSRLNFAAHPASMILSPPATICHHLSNTHFSVPPLWRTPPSHLFCAA